MVDFISSQLAEKTKQVESLELAVQNKDAKIDELRYGLNELSKESEYLKEQNYQQDREMNRVYYIVASKNELKDLALGHSNRLRPLQHK
jgi:chromosome segregation ATPase